MRRVDRRILLAVLVVQSMHVQCVPRVCRMVFGIGSTMVGLLTAAGGVIGADKMLDALQCYPCTGVTASVVPTVFVLASGASLVVTGLSIAAAGMFWATNRDTFNQRQDSHGWCDFRAKQV